MTMECSICSRLLRGRQKLFCSYRCKVKGQANAVYVNQKKRGLLRKKRLLMKKGGKCERCGYDRCLRALTFHHRDPSSKAFNLDLRSCSNRPREILAAEAAKCELLCANCHAEVEEERFLETKRKEESLGEPIGSV